MRAAAVVSLHLRAAVRARGRFRIALTCGPGAAVIFDALAQMPLPWTDVEILKVSDQLTLECGERDLTVLASIISACSPISCGERRPWIEATHRLAGPMLKHSLDYRRPGSDTQPYA